MFSMLDPAHGAGVISAEQVDVSLKSLGLKSGGAATVGVSAASGRGLFPPQPLPSHIHARATRPSLQSANVDDFVQIMKAAIASG